MRGNRLDDTKTEKKASATGHEPAEKTPYVVFISHSSSDSWIADRIAEQVRSIGAEAWLDKRDLNAGDVIVEEIIRGIDACYEALVLVSPTSAKSQWVLYEIGAVSGQHKRVTPILNHVRREAIIPMKAVKAIDLNEFDQFLIQLRRRVEDWLAKKAD